MYFERTHPSGSFVEVELVGRTLVRRWGQIDARRVETEKNRVEVFSSQTEARHALERQVRGLEGKGYEVGRKHPELLRAIEQAPDEEGPFLVFADWLIEQQDPRGELIVRMGLGRHEEASAWLEAHPELLPPWSVHTTLVWKLGFVHQLVFCPKKVWMGDHLPWLRRILRHPSAHFVRELVLEGLTERLSSDLEGWKALLGRPRVPWTVRLRRSPALGPLVGQMPGVLFEEGGG